MVVKLWVVAARNDGGVMVIEVKELVHHVGGRLHICNERMTIT